MRQLELTYGGGKTHTLITMRHLVNNPAKLPDLPSVREFTATIGQTPPQARVAALCFDKLDVETGLNVRGPDGAVRRLKQPWSVLAYQIAGDDGLKLMHAEGKAKERKTPPAELTLTNLLSLPSKDGLATLVLLDEVLLYAKMRCHAEPGFLDVLIGFFQYLTQAAAKADRCCVVASLLSSEPKDQADPLGRKLSPTCTISFSDSGRRPFSPSKRRMWPRCFVGGFSPPIPSSIGTAFAAGHRRSQGYHGRG